MGFSDSARSSIENNRRLQHRFSYSKFVEKQTISKSEEKGKKRKLSKAALNRIREKQKVNSRNQIILLIALLFISIIVLMKLFN